MSIRTCRKCGQQFIGECFFCRTERKDPTDDKYNIPPEIEKAREKELQELLATKQAEAPSDAMCPRCGKPATNIFHHMQEGEALGTAHCGCLYQATTQPTASNAGERETPKWPNVETAMEDPMFQQARAIMGTNTWFQDNALRNVINYVLSTIKPPACKGIPRPGCNYLAPCDTSCNKCGEIHHHYQMVAALASKPPACLHEYVTAPLVAGSHASPLKAICRFCGLAPSNATKPPAGEQKPVAWMTPNPYRPELLMVTIEKPNVNGVDRPGARPLIYGDIAPLPEQVAQDREHAENYRLIRRGQHWSVVDGIGNTLRGEDLDAAVDAIRAARAARARGEGQS